MGDTEMTEIGRYVVLSDVLWARVYDAEGNVLKRFKGETAWMDAERYASDLHFQDEMA